MKPFVVLSIFLTVQSISGAVASSPRSKRQVFDDAVIVQAITSMFNPSSSSSSSSSTAAAASTAGTSADFTPSDGPVGSSIIGSIDKVFGSIKNFDQYQCLERMVCQYMSSEDGEGEDPIAGTFVDSILNFLPGGGGSSGSPGTRFRPGRPGFRGGPRPRPPRRTRRPQRPFRRGPPPCAPPQCTPSQSFFKRRSGKVNRKITKRQASSIPGNIIRLLQVTGLDSLNAYPYVRAALLGSSSRPHTTRNGFTRGRDSCSRRYSRCPTDQDRLLDYINTHNGGLINQVQPEVENEAAPIINSILGEAIENGDKLFNGDSSSGSGSASSDPFGLSSLMSSGDTLLTQALVNGASGYLANGLTSLADSLTSSGKK